MLHLSRRNWPTALADTGSALAIEPSLAPAFSNRSAALYMLRRYDEAKAAGDTALTHATGEEIQQALFIAP